MTVDSDSGTSLLVVPGPATPSLMAGSPLCLTVMWAVCCTAVCAGNTGRLSDLRCRASSRGQEMYPLRDGIQFGQWFVDAPTVCPFPFPMLLFLVL